MSLKQRQGQASLSFAEDTFQHAAPQGLHAEGATKTSIGMCSVWHSWHASVAPMQMAACAPESDGAAAPADAASSLTRGGLLIAAADERAWPTPSLPKAAEMVRAELGANCRGTAQHVSIPATLAGMKRLLLLA